MNKINTIRVKQLEDQVRQLKLAKADTENKLRHRKEGNQYSKEQEALNSVIRSNDDYQFKHHYVFGKQSFDVVLHSPSVIEQAEIKQAYDRLTGDKGVAFTYHAQNIFLAVAYFQVVGDQIPDWLTDPNKIYQTDIVYQIWKDYQQWLDKSQLFSDNQLKEHPNWDPNLTPAINELGGLQNLVRSKSGRNMWTIMKFFKTLPNDPLLKSLTYSQREFIIASMNEDILEQEHAENGTKEDSHVEDRSFEKLFYAEEDVDLLADGDDIDKIYQQSLKLKAEADAEQGVSENYDEVLDKRIQAAYEDKMQKQRNTEAQVDENWKKLLDKANKYYNDD